MKVRELISILQNLDPEAFVYLNFETNIEDEFDVVTSDTNNILLVPIAKEEELTLNQVFDFLEKFSAKFVSEFDPKI